jgi:hypothetical protein
MKVRTCYASVLVCMNLIFLIYRLSFPRSLDVCQTTQCAVSWLYWTSRTLQDGTPMMRRLFGR